MPGLLSNRSAYALMHLTVFLWGFTAILGKSISIRAVPLVWYRIWLVVLVIALVNWGPIARVVFAETTSLAEPEFIAAERKQ